MEFIVSLIGLIIMLFSAACVIFSLLGSEFYHWDWCEKMFNISTQMFFIGITVAILGLGIALIVTLIVL